MAHGGDRNKLNVFNDCDGLVSHPVLGILGQLRQAPALDGWMLLIAAFLNRNKEHTHADLSNENMP